ncbi:MAG: hypothetical protein BXU00_01885 [Candidatus Nanoclepta minutus]|uniref:Type II secretion system protein GspF domain-containing protein n=1 Tax=Candidatus Nanoclepta minutus TaxID=1940235 RepID=A0A397WMX0_9ARCH|nr:MAG: hypothetical protein BXU00_01885 [Candidatus Nanoclepta minutus]
MLESLISVFKESFRPLLITSILFIVTLSIFSALFPNLSTEFIILLLSVYILIAIQIIVLNYYKIKYLLDKDLQYFLAYMYSLTFATTNMKRLFELASEAEEYKEISKIFKRILYLSNRYNFTIPEAIRYILPYVVNSEFKGFIERLATSIEIGEELTDFLEREHKKVIETYQTNYKKGLENVRTLQELGMSILTSLAFTFVILLILPLLMAIDVVKAFVFFLVALISTNVLIYSLSRYALPEDYLWVSTKDKPDEYKRLFNLFILSLSLFMLIFSLSFRIWQDPFISSSIASVPLLYISYRINILEKLLKKKEEKFSGFFNTIVGLSSVFGNNQVKILESARIHDFGELNENVNRLYNRITITRNYKESWYYFIVEIGSNLIQKITQPFYKMLEAGGDIEKASKRLYDILLSIIELRSMKDRFVSGARGFFYGGFIAFSMVLFVTVYIVSVMKTLFESLATLVSAEITGMLGIPLFQLNIDINVISLIVKILTIFQAFMIALTLKNIDGGSKLGIFIDFTLLLWIGLGLYIITGIFFEQVLPTFLQVPQV